MPQPFVETLAIQVYLDPCLPASCSFSAASFANGELGSIGRSRSRGAALVAYCRCDGPPVALVAAALVAPAEIAAALPRSPRSALVAIAAEFLRTAAAALVSVASILVTLAFKALARRTVAVGARFGVRPRLRPPAWHWPRPERPRGACGIHCGGGRGDGAARDRERPPRRLRRRGAVRRRLARWLRTLRTALMAMTTRAVAVMVRAAFLGTAAGTPDFDQFGHGWRFRRGFCGRGFRRRGVAGGQARWFQQAASGAACAAAIFSRRFRERVRSFDGFRCGFDDCGRSFNHGRRFFDRRRRGRNFGQQRRRRRGVAGDRLGHDIGRGFD